MMPETRGASSRFRRSDPRDRSDIVAMVLVLPGMLLLAGSVLVLPSPQMTQGFALAGIAGATTAFCALLALFLDRGQRRLASLLLGLTGLGLVLLEPLVGGGASPIRLLLTFSFPAALMLTAAAVLSWHRRPRLRPVS